MRSVKMAGRSMGLALLPALHLRLEIREADDVVVWPINGGRYYREMGLLWPQGAGRAPASGLIANLLRAVATQENPMRLISAPALFNTCNWSMLN